MELPWQVACHAVVPRPREGVYQLARAALFYSLMVSPKSWSVSPLANARRLCACAKGAHFGPRRSSMLATDCALISWGASCRNCMRPRSLATEQRVLFFLKYLDSKNVSLSSMWARRNGAPSKEPHPSEICLQLPTETQTRALQTRCVLSTQVCAFDRVRPKPTSDG